MVIAVAVRDRPYAAPPGVTDFGWRALGHPNFISGITSTTLIFVSSSGHSAFIPVISEVGSLPTFPLLTFSGENITFKRLRR